MKNKLHILSVYSRILGAPSQIDLMKSFLDYCKESKTFSDELVEHQVLIETSEDFFNSNSFPRDANIAICKNVDDFNGKFFELASGADTILFHSYPFALEKKCLEHKDLLKRAIWYTWGGDFERKKDAFVKYYYEALRGRKLTTVRFVQSLHGIACWNSHDVDLIKDNYRSKAKKYIASFAGETEASRGSKLNIVKPTSPVRVLVGNNANPTNSHILILDTLSKFKNEDIEIYMPLSYGSKNQEYIESVCEKGYKEFGAKFIPLTSYLDKTDYFKLLYTMSVAVFYQNRQQGGCNMHQLLMSGAKLYLNPDCAPARHFKEVGIRTFDSMDIPNSSFDEFKELDRVIVDRNRAQMQRESSLDYSDRRWSEIIHRRG